MTVVLYRPSLDARSGAGQLLEMQWRGARCGRHAGASSPASAVRSSSGCVPASARAAVPSRARAAARAGRARSSITVLPAECRARLRAQPRERGESASAARRLRRMRREREREFFRRAEPAAHRRRQFAARGRRVARALRSRARAHRAFSIRATSRGRFSPQRAAELRAARARRRSASSPRRRSSASSLPAISRSAASTCFSTARRESRCARPDVRFLVVGSKELPADARRACARRERRRAATGRRAAARSLGSPRSTCSSTPARFEEFGMVVAEAQAMGVPVLTSRLVGASECLPARLRAVAARAARSRRDGGARRWRC